MISALHFYQMCLDMHRQDPNARGGGMTMLYSGGLEVEDLRFSFGAYPATIKREIRKTDFGNIVTTFAHVMLGERKIEIRDDGNRSTWITEPNEAERIKLQLYYRQPPLLDLNELLK